MAFPAPMRPRLKRVAAYARVSSGKDAMLHSLSAQVCFHVSASPPGHSPPNTSEIARAMMFFSSS